MAKYKAQPGYTVGDGIRFDYAGEYETFAAAEIDVLNALVPKWITCTDAKVTKEAPVTPESPTEEEHAPAPKPRAPRKSSAK